MFNILKRNVKTNCLLTSLLFGCTDGLQLSTEVTTLDVQQANATKAGTFDPNWVKRYHELLQRNVSYHKGYVREMLQDVVDESLPPYWGSGYLSPDRLKDSTSIRSRKGDVMFVIGQDNIPLNLMQEYHRIIKDVSTSPADVNTWHAEKILALEKWKEDLQKKIKENYHETNKFEALRFVVSKLKEKQNRSFAMPKVSEERKRVWVKAFQTLVPGVGGSQPAALVGAFADYDSKLTTICGQALVQNICKSNHHLDENDLQSALTYACQYQDAESVHMLLEAGAKVQLQDLYHALTSRFGYSSDIFETLLKDDRLDLNALIRWSSLDLNALIRWSSAKTVLMLACECRNDHAVEQLLAAKKIDVNAKDEQNRTALWYVCKGDYLLTSAAERRSIVDQLLQADNFDKRQITKKCKNGTWSPLSQIYTDFECNHGLHGLAEKLTTVSELTVNFEDDDLFEVCQDPQRYRGLAYDSMKFSIVFPGEAVPYFYSMGHKEVCEFLAWCKQDMRERNPRKLSEINEIFYHYPKVWNTLADWNMSESKEDKIKRRLRGLKVLLETATQRGGLLDKATLLCQTCPNRYSNETTRKCLMLTKPGVPGR